MQADEAIARLRKEHRADPGSLRFLPLADALRRAGSLAEAEAVLRDGLRLFPAQAGARLLLGRVLLERGAAGEALSVLEALHADEPAHPAAAALVAELWAGQGRWADVESLLARADLIGIPRSVVDRLRAQLPVAAPAPAPAVAIPRPSPAAAPQARCRVPGADPFLFSDLAQRFADAGQPATAARVAHAHGLPAPALPVPPARSLVPGAAPALRALRAALGSTH